MLEATLTQLVESVTELQDNTKEAVHHLKEQTIELFARVNLLTRAMGNAPPAPQAAERLTDYSPPEHPKKKPVSNNHKTHNQKAKGKGPTPAEQNGVGSKSPKNLKSPEEGCFLCGGPHFVRACPQRKSLNAVQTKEPESDEEKEAAETGSIRMGALRLLNAVKGATHNFIATGEAERLGLTLSKDGSRMKAVNSKAQPIAGLAKEVPVSIGSWTSKANFRSVPLDDFQVILGMEFLQTARGVPMPFLDALCMMGDESPYVVPVVRKTTDARQISALQLKKGVKRGELTYVAALKLETGSRDETPTLPVVAKLLKEFKDVMPPELPKSLPPRRAVDYRIELEPGTRAPARFPYRMSPPELAELRKQLDELLKGAELCDQQKPFEIITGQQPSTPHTLAIGIPAAALSLPPCQGVASVRKLPGGAVEREFVVQWKNLPKAEASWEREDALRHEEDRIREYQQKTSTDTSG
uniref:Chromo domain-containing protein n=1 Tax=Ananas comosus var. bracteatus TaxID=296719 RepID=A0A6V7Q6K3_ANACO|nr:unnamed protein product [Ananas comosus var. bracteatus]